jgi:integrase
MLKPVRRHVLSCIHRPKGRSWRKCGCPIWVEGRLHGDRLRKSLDTANWEFANGKILEMEARKEELKESSVEDAVKDYIGDCHSRNLSTDSVEKFEQVLNPLQKFCTNRGVLTVRAIDLPLLKDFMGTLTDAAITKDKKIERLRTFGSYCEDMVWANGVPAKKLKKPVTRDSEVIPFTAEEWQAIRAAIDLYPERNSFGHDNRGRLRAFIYLLRYTGLRISDVTSLKPSRINNGRILIRTLKTGALIYLPLPPFVLEAAAAIDKGASYYFWSGEGKLKSCVGDWQRSIRRLTKLARSRAIPICSVIRWRLNFWRKASSWNT